MRSSSKLKKQDEQKSLNSDSPILDMKNAEIKALVKKAKSTGYITHEELSKALPSDALTADQIEDWYTALSELGINVIDQNEETNQEEQEEKSVGNVSEDEGTRSDDPVRMYLKEMGSVELLSREGEIAIAKRIEAGKELMIGGLYECPITMKHFLNWRDNVDNGSMMLRDIIDLETTYARLNGGANEPETNKIGEIALNVDVVRVKSHQVELSVKEKEKDIKKDEVTTIKKLKILIMMMMRRRKRQIYHWWQWKQKLNLTF